MAIRALVVTNKPEARLGPSETFIVAHQEGLPCEVVSLVGDPGRRRVNNMESKFVPSRNLARLGARWAMRQLGVASVEGQDRVALGNFLAKQGVDVVLAEYGNTAVSVMGACEDAGVPLVAHFHGWDVYTDHMRAEYGDRYHALFRQAAAIVGVSVDMCEQLVALGAPPEKVHHNACGARIPDRLLADPGAAPPRFVALGRLTEKKAPLATLMAMAQVVEQEPSAELVLVGDGPFRSACHQYIQAAGLGEHVALAGALPHEEALSILAGARCFVQHSVRASSGDHEGTPVSVLEAMGLGLPVVATRHGGIADVVGEFTGVLVNEFDVAAQGAAMLRYAKDPELAVRHGRAGRAQVLDNWTSEKSIERLWDIILGAIEACSGS